MDKDAKHRVSTFDAVIQYRKIHSLIKKNKQDKTKQFPRSGQYQCQSKIIYADTTRYRRATGLNGKTIRKETVISGKTYCQKHQPHETKHLPHSGQHLCQSEIIYVGTSRYRGATRIDGKTIRKETVISGKTYCRKHQSAGRRGQLLLSR